MKWETVWTVACLLFASLPRGQPDTTCHAFVGESVVLPCTTTSPGELDVSNLMLYWQIESVVVHFLHNGEDMPKFQNKYYTGRTSLFLDQLKQGNFSLKLSDVQLEDAAVYTCIYKQSGNQPTQTQKSKIKLNVSARSSTGEEHSPSGVFTEHEVTYKMVSYAFSDTTLHENIIRANRTEARIPLAVTFQRNMKLSRVKIFNETFSKQNANRREGEEKLTLVTIVQHAERHCLEVLRYHSNWSSLKNGHSQISSRSPGNVPRLDVLLSFHLLVTLRGWHL